MEFDQSYNKSELRDLASLFSRNQVMEWLEGDFSNIRAKIVRYFPAWAASGTKTYFDFLRKSYSIIENEYPNEYVYKNAFLNQWLIEELGSKNSKVYSEFRVGEAVADLVIFNGTSKAIEIKTGLDNDTRLRHQLEQYSRVFNYVYLIVPEANRDLYMQQNEQFGIIAWKKNKRQSFKMLREARLHQTIDTNCIMEILHTHEYKNIVLQYFGELPEMNSFTQFERCKEKIRKIPTEQLNQLFITAMKSRRQHNAFSLRYYPELNQISLALNFTKKQRKALISKLHLPIEVC